MAEKLDLKKIAKLVSMFQSPSDSLEQAAKEMDKTAKARFALGTATPADSSYLKRVQFKGIEQPRLSDKEQAMVRIQNQSFGDLPVQGRYPGSTIAQIDSLTTDLKKDPEDMLKSRASRMTYTDKIRKLSIQQKAEKEGVENLSDEEGRILFGVDKWQKFKAKQTGKSPVDSMLEFNKKLGEIDKTLYAETEDKRGNKIKVTNPDLDTKTITALEKQRSALQDSIQSKVTDQQYAKFAKKISMKPAEFKSKYQTAKREIKEALDNFGSQGTPLSRQGLAEQIAGKHGFTLEELLYINNNLGAGQ